MIRREGKKRKRLLKKRGEQSTFHWNRYKIKEMKGVI